MTEPALPPLPSFPGQERWARVSYTQTCDQLVILPISLEGTECQSEDFRDGTVLTTKS